MSKDDCRVGYGHPPKHTRFVPGESGNKGRKKKRPEFQAEMIARIRDERVVVNGASTTMFEMAIRSVVHNTIKRGHVQRLAPLRVAPPDNRDILNCGETSDDILDLARVDIEPAGHDHVLLAVDDRDEAIAIPAGNVADGDPAVMHGLGGFLGQLPIAAERGGGAAKQLARLVGPTAPPLIVAQLNLDAGERPSDAAPGATIALPAGCW